MTPCPRLYLSNSPELGWLSALEFGRVDDGQPDENWRAVNERFGYLHDGPGGRCVGFKVFGLDDFECDSAEVAAIWDPPHFDAPLLGLTDVPAAEIVIAARAFFEGRPSINRLHFNYACQARGEEALARWRMCLESGDSMAHFALGYTLYDLDRHLEAYRHLRHYVEIAPAHSWNWCWYGKAAAAIREIEEARRAYERAIELTEAGEDETDAPELLAELEGQAA